MWSLIVALIRFSHFCSRTVRSGTFHRRFILSQVITRRETPFRGSQCSCDQSSSVSASFVASSGVSLDFGASSVTSTVAAAFRAASRSARCAASHLANLPLRERTSFASIAQRPPLPGALPAMPDSFERRNLRTVRASLSRAIASSLGFSVFVISGSLRRAIGVIASVDKATLP